MKRGRIRDRIRWVLMLSAGCWLFQGGCLGFIQRELEVLMAPEANGTLIRSSFLYDVFGPGLLAFMSRIH